MKKTERIEVRLTKEMKERLHRRAEVRGVCVTHQLLEYIVRGLDDDDAHDAKIAAIKDLGEEQV